MSAANDCPFRCRATVLLLQALPDTRRTDEGSGWRMTCAWRPPMKGRTPGYRWSQTVIAALRAKGARILALGERGGLDGHFVELADGDAYGLYLTPDGHAVAGLLYGPDGSHAHRRPDRRRRRPR